MQSLNRDEIYRHVERELGFEWMQTNRDRVHAEIVIMTRVTELNGFAVTTLLYYSAQETLFQAQSLLSKCRPSWLHSSPNNKALAHLQDLAETRRMKHAVFRALAQVLDQAESTEQ